MSIKILSPSDIEAELKKATTNGECTKKFWFVEYDEIKYLLDKDVEKLKKEIDKTKDLLKDDVDNYEQTRELQEKEKIEQTRELQEEETTMNSLKAILSVFKKYNSNFISSRNNHEFTMQAFARFNERYKLSKEIIKKIEKFQSI